MSEDVTRRTGTGQLMSRIQALVGSSLRDAEQVFHDELASPHPFIGEVLAHLTTYRGKRLRPMLLLLAGSAVGDLKKAHSVLAAVVEMIHTATLVHDDVLDDATTRRHVATVNSRWNNETSVLLGDYLFTHAFHLTSTLGSAEACRLIGRATNVVCAGEMGQIAERGNLDLSEERYLEIIESKTAELCAVSTYLGAQWSGGSEAVCDALDSYGRSLGIAFQIADDILDVMGTEQAAGKSLGSDLEKQKLTLPLIYLLSQVRGSDAAQARDLIANPTRQTRLKLAPLIEKSGALEYARQRAIAYVLAARQQLSILPESPARQLLEDIADRVVDRDA